MNANAKGFFATGSGCTLPMPEQERMVEAVLFGDGAADVPRAIAERLPQGCDVPQAIAGCAGATVGVASSWCR